MELDKQIEILRDALEDAKSHLEYVGYGDDWERECAFDSGLPDRIDYALEIFGPPAAPPKFPVPSLTVQCPICSKRVKRGQGLKHHTKAKHSGE